MEEGKVIISAIEYARLVCIEEQFSTLKTLLFEDSTLSYNKEYHILGNQNKVIEYLKAIRPEEYKKRLEKLKKENGEKE